MTENPYMPAVDVRGVRKRYRGRLQALKGVNFTVPRGEIFGLLGPNGAGKSTLLKILLGIIRPSTCSGVMLGQPIGTKSVLQKVGYLPENVQFPDYLTGKQVVRYAAGMSGVCQKFCRKREEELYTFVGAQGFAGRKLRTYSKGMRQRIGLAQALVNDPELIFLDEPTDGLDPEGRCEMRQMLLRLKEQGKTIVISSHLLGELEMLCDHVAILKEGKMVEQGRLSELQAESSRTEVLVDGLIESQLEKALFDIAPMKVDAGKLSIKNLEAAKLQQLIDLLRSEDMTITGIAQQRYSLEEIFVDRVTDSDVTAGGER
ncbi:ABC transporter ATP-binding protein [Rubritalea marina]|uniref:ABC transporter ATP-binding protein n=1 Tax=Rubritalea marina TaxID=361055 RepID=UPI00035C4000|nr:ABC transporter ATP-binding protein [Rubritalea marina]